MNKNMDCKEHFSIRKLSVGAASVLIGISFMGLTNPVAKADKIDNSTQASSISSQQINTEETNKIQVNKETKIETNSNKSENTVQTSETKVGTLKEKELTTSQLETTNEVAPSRTINNKFDDGPWQGQTKTFTQTATKEADGSWTLPSHDFSKDYPNYVLKFNLAGIGQNGILSASTLPAGSQGSGLTLDVDWTYNVAVRKVTNQYFNQKGLYSDTTTVTEYKPADYAVIGLPKAGYHFAGITDNSGLQKDLEMYLDANGQGYFLTPYQDLNTTQNITVNWVQNSEYSRSVVLLDTNGGKVNVPVEQQKRYDYVFDKNKNDYDFSVNLDSLQFSIPAGYELIDESKTKLNQLGAIYDSKNKLWTLPPLSTSTDEDDPVVDRVSLSVKLADNIPDKDKTDLVINYLDQNDKIITSKNVECTVGMYVNDVQINNWIQQYKPVDYAVLNNYTGSAVVLKNRNNIINVPVVKKETTANTVGQWTASDENIHENTSGIYTSAYEYNANFGTFTMTP